MDQFDSGRTTLTVIRNKLMTINLSTETTIKFRMQKSSSVIYSDTIQTLKLAVGRVRFVVGKVKVSFVIRSCSFLEQHV